MANKSGSQVGLSITLIGLGGVFIIGGMAGTLANALAGLWAPDILVDNGGNKASPRGLGLPGQQNSPLTGGLPALFNKIANRNNPKQKLSWKDLFG